MINRDKTGHAARDLIIELMHEATSEQWNDWYRRILIKDLRCGVSEKTVNNVAKRMGIKFRALNLIPILFATLFTVFSLTPHLRSFIRIRLYQSFHCSEVASCINSIIKSLAACPVLSRLINKIAFLLKLTQLG